MLIGVTSPKEMEGAIHTGLKTKREISGDDETWKKK